MRKAFTLGIAAALVALALATAALATGSAASVKIGTRKIPKLGTVLVNGKGFTLYMFVPDKQKKVTCVKTCAAVWPPVKLAAGQKAVATGSAKQSLIGSDKNPSGGKVVTYNKWPLYTYVADSAPGQATGEGVSLSGGKWYVISPSGQLIKHKT
jgi:predicted lipoprotein with Yx(FWY)xxD motif